MWIRIRDLPYRHNLDFWGRSTLICNDLDPRSHVASLNHDTDKILLVIPCLFMQYEKILMVWVRITQG